jgi:hypothetical protein
MPQYLVSDYLPDNFDPSTQDEATIEAIHALSREMIACGRQKIRLRCARSDFALPNGREGLLVRAAHRLPTPLRNPLSGTQTASARCTCHMMLGQRSSINLNLCSRE